MKKKNENKFTCKNCNQKLPINDKSRHEVYCKRIPSKSNSNAKAKSNLNSNNSKRMQQIYIPKCSKCNKQIIVSELEDHLYSHQIEEEMKNEEQRKREELELADRREAERLQKLENSQNYQSSSSQNNRSSSAQNQNQQSRTGLVDSFVNEEGDKVEVFHNILPRGERIEIKKVTKKAGQNITIVETSTYDINQSFIQRLQQTIPSSRAISGNLRMSQINMDGVNIHQGDNLKVSYPGFSMEPFKPGDLNYCGGLSQNIINQFPLIILDDKNKLFNDNKNCPICISDFEMNENVILLPCFHAFHDQCIKSWFQSKNTCPLCKMKYTSKR